MSPSSHRRVSLVVGCDPDGPLVAASVYRDYPAGEVGSIQERWQGARDKALDSRRPIDAVQAEHTHWDWRNKADTVEAGVHRLVCVEVNGEPQGLMAVFSLPRPARSGTGHVVYVDYLETAPWNLRLFTDQPRYLGVGTVLLAEAVRLSVDLGLGGQVGLHSLPQAEGFYRRHGMTEAGTDPEYFDLVYFEFVGGRGTDWLTEIGEAP